MIAVKTFDHSAVTALLAAIDAYEQARVQASRSRDGSRDSSYALDAMRAAYGAMLEARAKVIALRPRRAA